MKKLLAIFALLSLAFLASCGEGKETAKSSCDKILAYTECAAKKAGTDEATIKTTIEQAKKGYDALGDKAEETCKAAIEQMKKAPLVEGCSL